MVGLGGGAVSFERGTLVVAIHVRSLDLNSLMYSPNIARDLVQPGPAHSPPQVHSEVLWCFGAL